MGSSRAECSPFGFVDFLFVVRRKPLVIIDKSTKAPFLSPAHSSMIARYYVRIGSGTQLGAQMDLISRSGFVMAEVTL